MAGDRTEAPKPCMARAAMRTNLLLAKPPNKDAAVKAMIPPVNARRRP